MSDRILYVTRRIGVVVGHILVYVLPPARGGETSKVSIKRIEAADECSLCRRLEPGSRRGFPV
ncbi:hypothetical protein [Arthrobacter sp. H41]|uniref:hypothetical protein n=1 Tax=Arthrobacter sp. H41 TaxID=1312978 RepID=UPI001C1DF8F1|nr:hypothetical protein [Arthrobacter sp. H41]